MLVIGSDDPQGVAIVREVGPVAKEIIVTNKEAYDKDSNLPNNLQCFSQIVKIADNQVVHFSDGSSKRVDVIILCTSYKYAFPYLHDSYGFNVADEQGMHPLYKLTFNPRFPSMAFLGTVMDSTLAYCDMQVMWALRVWLGQQPLPHTAEMLGDCKNGTDTSRKDLAVLYKELASYSETRSPSPALVGILKETGNQAEKKSKCYTVLSSKHWIVTNN